jgi:Na+-transporting NADH:ubiquinone oxidoreductase subunit NqrC
MSEVEDANKKAIEVKDLKKVEEKELEMKIVDYNRQKTLREEEQLHEARRIKEEKEREVQRLRELQEKAQDR